MSTMTGKDGFNTFEEVHERTVKALSQKDHYFITRDVQEREIDSDASKFIVESVVPGQSVCELGCGYGRNYALLQGIVSEYTGYDVVPERLDYAAKKYGPKGAKFMLLDVNDADTSKKYDVIIMMDVIQHLLVPDAIKLLKFAKQICKPLGKMRIWDGRLFPLSLEECEKRYLEETEPNHMVPKSIPYLEKETGLKFTHLGGDCFEVKVTRFPNTQRKV